MGGERRFFALLRMTMGGQNDRSKHVILRSFATKNLWDRAFEAGEKILRFAQNDNGGTE